MKKSLWLQFFVLLVTNYAYARTDLGPGNQYVFDRFESYKQNGFICDEPKLDQKRVILSGFGPFSGSSTNISGEVLKFMTGIESVDAAFDVVGAARELVIENQSVQICFLITATTWDLAAAILVSEAERFQPDFILMTGQGTSKFVLETTAINQTLFSVGYAMDGSSLIENKPLKNFVLPAGPGIQASIDMSWNESAVEQAIEFKTAALGYAADVESAVISPDNYICNNLRFVVAHAAQGVALELAGGLIQLQPQFVTEPFVGFAHYPLGVSLEAASLEAWGEILKDIVAATLIPSR